MKAKQLWDWAWHGLAGCVLDISLQLQVKFAGDSKGPELSRGKLYSSFSFAYHLFSSACLALVSSAQAGAHVLDTTVWLCSALRVGVHQATYQKAGLRIQVNPLFQQAATSICMFLHSVAVTSYLLQSLFH